MKKILVRAVSGCIYVALIVVALLLPSPYMFLCLFVLFGVMGIMELHHLVDDGRDGTYKNVIVVIDCIGGIALFALFFSWCSGLFAGNGSLLPTLIYAFYLVSRMVVQLYIKNVSALHSFAYSCFIQMYVALPLSLLNVLYFDNGAGTLLAIFILIWLNDTGAFCIGSMIGRHRLFERVSPKKSWEGFWGGMLCCIIGGVVFHCVGDGFFGKWTLVHWIAIGITVSVFATWGDLVESLLKRTLNVKDSGHLIPGHGGILDRIDSLLLVVPAMVLFFILVKFLTYK